MDLVLSVAALGKSSTDGPTVDHRRSVLQAVARSRPWLGVVVTDARLIADIATGYDAVVLGADKWAQVLDPAWYGGSLSARDDALARLPRVLVAPRSGDHPAGVELLDVSTALHTVSASGPRRPPRCCQLGSPRGRRLRPLARLALGRRRRRIATGAPSSLNSSARCKGGPRARW